VNTVAKRMREQGSAARPPRRRRATTRRTGPVAGAGSARPPSPRAGQSHAVQGRHRARYRRAQAAPRQRPGTWGSRRIVGVALDEHHVTERAPRPRRSPLSTRTPSRRSEEPAGTGAPPERPRGTLTPRCSFHARTRTTTPTTGHTIMMAKVRATAEELQIRQAGGAHLFHSKRQPALGESIQLSGQRPEPEGIQLPGMAPPCTPVVLQKAGHFSACLVHPFCHANR
jgi:hypothetical protein